MVYGWLCTHVGVLIILALGVGLLWGAVHILTLIPVSAGTATYASSKLRNVVCCATVIMGLSFLRLQAGHALGGCVTIMGLSSAASLSTLAPVMGTLLCTGRPPRSSRVDAGPRDRSCDA